MLKIIISPAKKMNHNNEVIDWDQWPIFLDQASEIKNYLAGKSYAELKNIWQCNDKIAKLNHERLQKMNLVDSLTPAVLAYEGLQYQYMAPQVFDQEQWDYVRQHLKILSGFYGLLNATDGITPYRLEMQAKCQIKASKNLYDYWQSLIYDALVENASVVINLASKEYSRIIEKYLADNIKFVTITFGELIKVNGSQKIKTKATAVKMARGEMVRYMAEHQIREAEALKKFARLNYTFSGAHSTAENYVFLKESR